MQTKGDITPQAKQSNSAYTNNSNDTANLNYTTCKIIDIFFKVSLWNPEGSNNNSKYMRSDIQLKNYYCEPLAMEKRPWKMTPA